MNTSTNQPLVSVGIPTYNRPQGLRRTLECVTNQSYTNLEIIVSDNCSPGKETQDVVKEFANKDPRVKYYRQDKNEGGTFNFKFVLEKATGEYFAWIADDDEWDMFFIEKCLLNIQNYSSVMCKIQTVYKKTGLTKEGELPDLSPDYSVYQNMRENLLNPTPGLIYSLHRRRDILWFLRSNFFDFSDCFFASKLLMEGNGIFLIRDYSGFKSNIIDSEKYCPKLYNPQKNRCFQYGPFLYHHFRAISICPKIPYAKKIILKTLVLWTSARWFTKYEKNYKSVKVAFVKIILRLVRSILKLRKIRS